MSSIDFTGGANSTMAAIRVTSSDDGVTFKIADIMGGERSVTIHKVEAQLLADQLQEWLHANPLTGDDLEGLLRGMMGR